MTPTPDKSDKPAISPELQKRLEEEAEKSNGYTLFAKETKAPIFAEGFKCGATSSIAREIHMQGMISIEEHEEKTRELLRYWIGTTIGKEKSISDMILIFNESQQTNKQHGTTRHRKTGRT